PAHSSRYPLSLHDALPICVRTRVSTLIDFGRDVCGDLSQAESCEWLVTNGLGGYASGTVAGLLTRRYHGLLVAALKPPVGRTLLDRKSTRLNSSHGSISYA